MSVNARPASAQFEDEIHSDSDDRPMSQDAEPNAGLDNGRMSQQRQQTQSPIKDTATWITESAWSDYIFKDNQRLNSSIFKVPKFLKDTKREAYEPQRVSLGPYHHENENLKMNHHKGRALHRMAERSLMKPVDPNRSLMKPVDPNSSLMKPIVPNSFADDAMAEILKLESLIRASYERDISYDGRNLAVMLCFDGCFLLQILTTQCADRSMLGNEKNEIIVFSSKDIVKDVLMLENQVPFFVLQKLLELVLKSIDTANEMLLNMVMSLLKPYYTVHIKEWWRNKLVSGTEDQHLLGFLYEAIVHPGPNEDTGRGTVCSICIDCLGRCINSKDGVNLERSTESIPKNEAPNEAPNPFQVAFNEAPNEAPNQFQVALNEAPNQFQRIPPAVELRNAGIKFKPCHGGIEKINFDRRSATFFLPPICITDITEVLFRNLIAFEMCSSSQSTYVSYYVNIMGNLIHSEKDVALLGRMGVLTNWLGRDEEVVDLFNSLCKATAPVNLFHAFNSLAERVNAYYEKGFRVRIQLAKLVQDYCSTPWRAVASAAAIFLLVLTLVQTIYSVKAVHNGGTAVHNGGT